VANLPTLEALARPTDKIAGPKQAAKSQKAAAAPNQFKTIIPQPKRDAKNKKKSKKSDMSSVLSGL
jgi:hypothetical protein